MRLFLFYGTRNIPLEATGGGASAGRRSDVGAFGRGARRLAQAAQSLGRVLWLAARRLGFNRGPVAAAAIAYYGLVSLFPLVLLLLSALGFVFPVTTLAERLVRYAADLLPGSADFFRESLNQLVVHRGTLGLTALVTLYWSASGAFAALSHTLDLVWDTPVCLDPKGPLPGPVRLPPWAWVRRRLRALAVVLGVGLLFLLSVLATTYLRLAERLQSLPGLGSPGSEAARALLGLASLSVTAFVFLAIYALIPRRPPPWSALWPGTLVATVLFELAKGSFAWYATRLRRYEWVYGSVTTPIGMLVWFYLVALIVIYGAEVGAVSRWDAAGAGSGGEAGVAAPKADTLGVDVANPARWGRGPGRPRRRTNRPPGGAPARP